MPKNPHFKILPRSEKIYNKYYQEFEAKRIELNISVIDDALKAVFEDWSSEYASSSLSTRLSAVVNVLSKNISYDNLTYQNILASIRNMKKNSEAQKQATPFTKVLQLIRYVDQVLLFSLSWGSL